MMRSQHRDLTEMQRFVPDDEPQRVEERPLTMRKAHRRRRRQLLGRQPREHRDESRGKIGPRTLKLRHRRIVLPIARAAGEAREVDGRRADTAAAIVLRK